MDTTPTAPKHTQYELRFRSLFREGLAYAFPCNPNGRVDIDSLSDNARNSYFYARTVIGRELTMPAVQPVS